MAWQKRWKVPRGMWSWAWLMSRKAGSKVTCRWLSALGPRPARGFGRGR